MRQNQKLKKKSNSAKNCSKIWRVIWKITVMRKSWKRFGDLILANLATAIRENNKILVVDYFDENLPTVEIEAAENLSLTEAR